MMDELIKLAMEGETQSFEWKYKTLKGSTFKAEVSLQKLVVNNEAFIYKIVRALKDKKAIAELEKKFMHARKVEAAGALAGEVAHNLNNYLGVIIGNSELLLDEDHFLNDESREDMKQIMNSALDSKRLVNQLLVFSRQEEAGKIYVNLEIFLKETVNKLLSFLPSNIKVNSKISKCQHKVFANPSQIQQVLVNLCLNSVDALRESGGEIIVELKEVISGPGDQVAGFDIQEGAYILISVKDTGAGMSSDILEMISDSSFITKQGASSTGLAEVMKITKDHDGFFSIKSSPEEGTEVNIFLPVDDDR